MSAHLNQSLRDLAGQFRSALCDAQAERAKFPDVAEVDGEWEVGWMFRERDAMLRGVNQVRRRVGQPPLPIEAVKAVEQQACGHVDYTAKYAFYCAELALGCSPIWKGAAEEK